MMTAGIFVDGDADETQLRVQANSIQEEYPLLQTWEADGGDVLVAVTDDGRLQIGDDLGIATADALLEVHRDEASLSKPKRGFHSTGRISDGLNGLVEWLVGELEVRGSEAIGALQTALRIRATNLNSHATAHDPGAELRAADVEVVNDGSVALPKATGLQVSVTNAAGKTIDEAVGLHVKLSEEGITAPYAIYAEGPGVAHFEDYLEVKRPAAVPGTPPADFMRIYPKDDDKLYTKNSSGNEVQLGGAPTDATYLVAQSNGGLSNEVDLGALTSGILKHTVAAGVSTPATASPGTDYYKPGDATSDTALRTLAYYNTLQNNSVAATQRVNMNFIPGNGISLATADDSPNNATKLTIAVSAPPIMNGGRLTLSSTTSVPSSDMSAVSTLYYLPQEHGQITLWDSAISALRVVNFSGATVSLSLASTSANTLYDVFGYYSGGTLALELLAWASSGLGTAARATALAIANGLRVKSGDATRRYLGTLLARSAGSSNDTLSYRDLWNAHNRVSRKLFVTDATASWTYNAAVWRATLNTPNTHSLYIVSGLDGVSVRLDMAQVFSVSNARLSIGIGKNSTTPTVVRNYSAPAMSTGVAMWSDVLPAGYNRYISCEMSLDSATATLYGNSNAYALEGVVEN